MLPHSPWRIPAFRKLFAATAASQLGTQVGYVAIPLVALELDAGPGQVGLLATLSTVAFLLIGLPAGVWVDRLRRRPVLISADLIRAGLLASIPIAWWLDALTMPQLYVVVLASGCCTVFFDVASQSYLPAVVGREGLVQANGAVVSLGAVSAVGGRGIGGVLVKALTAPVALVLHAVSYLLSALWLAGIRVTEPPVAPVANRRHMAAEMRDGLRHVVSHRELRALALGALCANFGIQLINTMLPVLFISELRLSPAVLGAYWMAGGVGVFVGSRFARPLAARLGYGRTLATAGLVIAPAGIFIALLDRGAWLWLAAGGSFLASIKFGIDNVLGVSLRQRLTPDALLGRMNATFRFVMMGALAVASGVSGLIGQYGSVRAALWTGAVFLALAFLPVLLSPIRGRVALPEQEAVVTPS